MDRYELVAEIASGGMATVFLARLANQDSEQTLVALKRLHPHLAREPSFVAMFLDEARLATRIHHPNVVPILEVGGTDGDFYLVMEYVEGDTLAHLMAREAAAGKRVPVPIVTRILCDALLGLHAAHELRDEQGRPTGLVHSDVSPQNILTGRDGSARITDFGVARAAARLADDRAGRLKGKVAYMAPEQAAGDEDLDRRADVFAAGIVLWEALASRRLFKSTNEAATLSRVASDVIVAPTKYAPNLAPEITAVCMKALERDRSRRYQTCAEFADALEGAAATQGELATQRELAQYVDAALGRELDGLRLSVRSPPSEAAASPAKLDSRPKGLRPEADTDSLGLPLVYSDSSRAGTRSSRPPENNPGATTIRYDLAAPRLPLDIPELLGVVKASRPRGRWLTPLLALVALALVGLWFALGRTAPSPPAPTSPPSSASVVPEVTRPGLSAPVTSPSPPAPGTLGAARSATPGATAAARSTARPSQVGTGRRAPEIDPANPYR